MKIVMTTAFALCFSFTLASASEPGAHPHKEASWVEGGMVVNGIKYAFTNVYAVVIPDPFDKKKQEIRLVFTDVPVDGIALHGERDELQARAATGKFHAVAVTLRDDPANKDRKIADSDDIYTKEINDGWINSSGMDVLKMADENSSATKALSGKLSMKTHRFEEQHATLQYEATFEVMVQPQG